LAILWGMHCLGPRVILPEVLDTLSYEEAQANLRDLVELNRRWGGHSTLRALLREVAKPDESFSVLDVGAASGDAGILIRESYPQAHVISMDAIASHLTDCPHPKLAGDAFAIPFRQRSFDFVFCALFLHHFPDDEVVELLRRFGQVARKAVLVVDLERHPLSYYFLPMTQALFGWDAVTVNDGKISVEAAFKPRELESLATRAGLKNARARAYRPAFRVTLVAEL
jgi:ubiquinone/menaquinone biosynthesis C-methylase UbiE